MGNIFRLPVQAQLSTTTTTMGKSLRSKGQQRNKKIMREKVFGPAREKMELSIAKRLHGEEVLRKKAQEKADKADGEWKWRSGENIPTCLILNLFV